MLERAFALLLFVLFLLATGNGSLGDIVPMLGVYAFAALRLFPALQQVYTSFAALRFSRPTLDKLHEDMTEIGLADPEAPAAAAPRRKLHLAERSRSRTCTTATRPPSGRRSPAST